MNMVDLSPGISQPLCGWEWVQQHWNDPYPEPHIELITPTSRYSITIKKPGIMKEVAKIIMGG